MVKDIDKLLEQLLELIITLVYSYKKLTLDQKKMLNNMSYNNSVTWFSDVTKVKKLTTEIIERLEAQ